MSLTCHDEIVHVERVGRECYTRMLHEKTALVEFKLYAVEPVCGSVRLSVRCECTINNSWMSERRDVPITSGLLSGIEPRCTAYTYLQFIAMKVATKGGNLGGQRTRPQLLGWGI